MRSLVKASSAAMVMAMVLLGSAVIAPAQQRNNIDQLIKQFEQLTEARQHQAAVPIAQQILAARESQYGPDHRIVAIWLSNLAFHYQNLARHAEAEPLLKRALAIEEKSFGPANIEVATTLRNLASLHWDQGR